MRKTFSYKYAVLTGFISVLLYAVMHEFYFPETDGYIAACYIVFWMILFCFQLSLLKANRQLIKIVSSVYIVSVVLIALLWYFPTTPRQKFFRKAAGIRIDMSAEDVEGLLNSYNAVNSSQFNGKSGPSVRPLPTNFSGAVVYLSGNRDAFYKDRLTVVFRSGRVTDVVPMAD